MAAPSVSVEPIAAHTAGCDASASIVESAYGTGYSSEYYKLQAAAGAGWTFSHFTCRLTASTTVPEPHSSGFEPYDDTFSSSNNPTENANSATYGVRAIFAGFIDYEAMQFPFPGRDEWTVSECVAHFVPSGDSSDESSEDSSEEPGEYFTVTTESKYAAGGIVTGGGTYSAGTTITLTATPNQGYQFAGWASSAGETNPNPSFPYTVTSDVTWTAYFGTRRLIYFDVSPTPPSDPGDAVVTFDFNPKTWICGVPYVHHFSLNIAYTIGASTTSFTATGQETRTITQAQLATVSTITFTITARSDTCSEGYTPPPLDVVVVVQQANVRTVFAKSSHTVNVGKNYLLTISSGAIVSLAEVP